MSVQLAGQGRGSPPPGDGHDGGVSNGPLLITAGQLIQGPVTDRVTDGAVLVRDGVVAAAGPVDGVVRSAGPDVVRRSFPAATILPGLVNGHVHLCFEPGPDPVRAVREADDDELLAGMARAARTLLDSGVTTARDLGDRGGLALRVRDAIAVRAARRPADPCRRGAADPTR